MIDQTKKNATPLLIGICCSTCRYGNFIPTGYNKRRKASGHCSMLSCDVHRDTTCRLYDADENTENRYLKGITNRRNRERT